MPPRPAAVQPQPSSLARLMEARVRSQQLFLPGARLLVAVSGGPDSVALLSLLTELAPSWGLSLAAIHVNHGLRGEESEEDARFAARLCRDLGIELRSARLSLEPPRAGRRRSSLQERARDARYAVLLAEGRTLAVDRIALGHQADDQAETLLMWMLRGAGTTGLAGIPPIRDGLFIRPLLGISREQILEYLRARGVPYRNDSSNAKPVYLRNRIRQDLLPRLKVYNPAIVDVLARQAKVLKDEDLYLEAMASAALEPLTQSRPDGSLVVDRAGLLALPPALRRRAVRRLFRRLNPSRPCPSFTVVESVLHQVFLGRSGAAVTALGLAITQEYARVRFGPAGLPADGTPQPSLPLPCPSALRWPLTGQIIRARLADEAVPVVPKRRQTAVFDLDRFTLDLTVRTWRCGDAFQPAGMRGRSKKLQDFFSDRKIPRRERGLMPLVAAPEGILWVAGHRADHRFAATPETRRRLILEVQSSRHH